VLPVLLVLLVLMTAISGPAAQPPRQPVDTSSAARLSATTGRAPAMLEGHDDQVSALAFQPQGPLPASGDRDGGLAPPACRAC